MCINRLQNSCDVLDDELVNISFELGRSLGVDCFTGDGVAAALQGLLFDFRLWRKANLTTRAYLLESLSAFLAPVQEHFYSCIGMQVL